jgi:hypothetical protein
MNLNSCTYFVKEVKMKPDKLVGYLNRKVAFDYFHTHEIGTPEYEDRKGYYLIQELVSNGVKSRLYWNKNSKFKEYFNQVNQ